MDIEDMPAPLLRLKILIWVHSAIGAALGLAFLGTVLAGSQYEWLPIGILGCVVVWMLGFGPIRRKAAELSPMDRVPPKDLPSWIVPAMAVGAFLSPLSLAAGPAGGLTFLASLLLLGTIVVRRVTCRSLDLQVHEKTWGGVVIVLVLGLLWNFGFMMFLFVSLGHP
jgi:hypothetical protein